MLTIENAPDVLTVPQVQELFQANKCAVYTMIKRKELPAVRIGGGYRIPKKALIAYLENRS